MLISEANSRFAKTGQDKLMDCKKLIVTIGFKRKVEKALGHLESFFASCKKPVISCGGGKDSTAVAILARQINPSTLIVCGDPPNPLSDREAHLQNLFAWLGGEISRIPYSWEVAKVLAGAAKYPDGLKMRVLSAYHKKHGIDGVIFGIRRAESRTRRLVLASKGSVYRTQTGMRCAPLADFTALEALAVAFMFDAPINPVYTRQKGACDFEHLRDGTWWPHGIVDRSSWLAEYYPEHYENYLKARAVYGCQQSRICHF